MLKRKASTEAPVASKPPKNAASMEGAVATTELPKGANTMGVPATRALGASHQTATKPSAPASTKHVASAGDPVPTGPSALLRDAVAAVPTPLSDTSEATVVPRRSASPTSRNGHIDSIDLFQQFQTGRTAGRSASSTNSVDRIARSNSISASDSIERIARGLATSESSSSFDRVSDDSLRKRELGNDLQLALASPSHPRPYLNTSSMPQGIMRNRQPAVADGPKGIFRDLQLIIAPSEEGGSFLDAEQMKRQERFLRSMEKMSMKMARGFPRAGQLLVAR